jgi:methylenetetrahydrofolate reductase (NADPH)
MVPIIPELAISSSTTSTNIATDFQDRFAEDLIQAVEGCKTNADIKTVGIEWAIQQSLELKAAGVPVFIILGNQRILNK